MEGERIIKNKKLIYFCHQPNLNDIQGSIEKHNKHSIVDLKNVMIIWPDEISPTVCSPNNLSELNKVVDTNVITIVDRIKNKNNITRIAGHINRSGQSFLVGSTPFLDKPQFPDMSNLYDLRGNKKTTVHTIGRERYLSTERLNRKTVWSESIALVAIVFSYLGFTVEGFGVPDQKTNENTVQFIINNP